MSDSILKQIAELGRLSARDLQDRWRELYGSEPPGYNRTFLTKRLAYRLQELAHGGLSDTIRSQMAGILREAKLNEDGATGGNGRQGKRARDLPTAGTRLVREWNGKRYEVTVLVKGFEFEGRRYRSLTAITKAITGTHWNGRAFFGMRPPSGNGSGR